MRGALGLFYEQVNGVVFCITAKLELQLTTFVLLEHSCTEFSKLLASSSRPQHVSGITTVLFFIFYFVKKRKKKPVSLILS